MDVMFKGIISKEQHDCILAGLDPAPRGFQKRDADGQRIFLPPFEAKDSDGKPKLDDDGNKIIITNAPEMEADADGNEINRLLNVRDWAQEMLEGKAYNCWKREKIAKVLAGE